MPKLPVRQGSQQTVTTQSSGVRQDPRAAGQAGRNLQGIGTGIVGLADQVAKVKDTWDKARVTNQYTTARNTRKAELHRIMAAADADLDHENIDKYRAELEELRSQDVELDDDNVKALNQSDTDLDVNMADIKLTGLYRSKMVNHQRGEILKDSEATKEFYITSGLGKRTDARVEYLKRLKNSKDLGFMTPAEYQSELKDVERWEEDRAMRMVGEDPQKFLDLHKNSPENGGFDLKDRNKFTGLVNMAISNLSRDNKIKALALSQEHITNQAKIGDMIFGIKAPDIPISQKLLDIELLVGTNKISESYATKARRFLTRKVEVNKRKTAPEKTRIIRLAYQANNTFESGGDDAHKRYLQSLKEIQGLLLTSTNLTDEDRSSLQRELETITKKKRADAIGDLKGNKSTPRADIYKNADVYFNRDISQVSLRDEALGLFFDRMIGTDMDAEEAKKVMEGCRVEVLYKHHEIVRDTYDMAYKKYGLGADLRLKETSKKSGKGGYAIILYDEKGNRQKLAWEVGSKTPPKEVAKRVPQPSYHQGSR